MIRRRSLRFGSSLHLESVLLLTTIVICLLRLSHGFNGPRCLPSRLTVPQKNQLQIFHTLDRSICSIIHCDGPKDTIISRRQRQSYFSSQTKRSSIKLLLSTSSAAETTTESNFTTTTSSSASMSPDQLEMTCQEKTKSHLRGKTVFLTGATGGLGRALAWQLADCQVKHLILSGRSQSALDEVVQDCQAIADKTTASKSTNVNTNTVIISTVVCDLSDTTQVQKAAQQAIDKAKAAGSPAIDILINNGGVSSRSSFLETKLEVDQTVMQINFFSGAAFCKAIVPDMIKQHSNDNNVVGRIIWISSVQGLLGIPERTSYAASKFAVQGYTESLRAELHSLGVFVHTVSPGYIRTNLSRNAYRGDGSIYDKVDATTAAGADPNQVAVEILDRCITNNQVDFTIATTFSAVVAIWLRTLCPGILRNQLVKRYDKSQKAKQD